MAKSKEDISYATSQARLSEDEAVRVGYVNGTPLEGGKIADSAPIDLFATAHNIPSAKDSNNSDNQSQMQRDTQQHASTEFTTGAPRLPKKGPPPTMGHKS